MTHTPGLGDKLHKPPTEQVDRLLTAFGKVRKALDRMAPDLIVAFVNDHFDMWGINSMPAYAVGVSDVHYGPTEDAVAWLEMQRRSWPGSKDYAMAVLKECVGAGFDMYRAGATEFNHNVLMPKKFLWPDRDIPVVPIFINCFSPPLPSWRRSYELGKCVRQVIESRQERVLLLASGGLSHWPPFVSEDEVPDDDVLLHRMLRVQQLGTPARLADPSLRADFHKRESLMAASDRELVNVEWDKRLMTDFANAEVEAILQQDYETVERLGGNGGHEMAMWLALAGVLNGTKGNQVIYEHVKEWMGGVGVLTYGIDLE